jgi:hypothetical protein
MIMHLISPKMGEIWGVTRVNREFPDWRESGRPFWKK